MAEKKSKKHDVVIYSLPTCVYCNLAKEFFKKHDIKFKNINVMNNQKAGMEMVEKTSQNGVPVIVIDGNWDDAVIGFDQPALKKKLEIK